MAQNRVTHNIKRKNRGFLKS